MASLDKAIDALTPTYGKMRTWPDGNSRTPQPGKRQQQLEAAFSEGVLLAASGPVYYIPRRQANWMPPPGSRQLYFNASYVIWRFDPSELTQEVDLPLGPQVDTPPPGTVSVK